MNSGTPSRSGKTRRAAHGSYSTRKEQVAQMLNTKEMQLQSLETIGEYLQGVRQAVEESGNDDQISISCISAGKRLFQTMTAAENEEPPVWYLQAMARVHGDSETEEMTEIFEELKDRKYNEVPTDEENRKALRDMIDSVESAAYDLLKTCGIYSRIPADEYDSTGVLSDFSGEVEDCTKNILEAITKAGEHGDRFVFSLFWKQVNAPEDQDSPDQQADDKNVEPPKWMTLSNADPEDLASEVEDGTIYTGNFTADLVEKVAQIIARDIVKDNINTENIPANIMEKVNQVMKDQEGGEA